MGREKSENDGFFTADKLPLCIAEFVGTGLLMFMGCMGCITGYEGIKIPHYMPALSFGLTIMYIIQLFGHISGAHLNPVVTLVALIYGHLKISAVPAYIFGQIAGAIVGFGSLKMLIPKQYVYEEILNNETNETTDIFCLCLHHPDVSALQALILETVITAILILLVCSIWDERNKNNMDSAPLRFGFAIAAMAIAAAPFSGGGMNPARSLAPAIWNGNWKDQWIYWVGPTAGALIAAYFYKTFFSIPKRKIFEAELQDISPLQKIENEQKS